MSDKHPGGRPLKFKSVEELQTMIDDYFEVTPKEEWTWTGLALHLDTTRQTLYEYNERPEFAYPIKKALQRVENGYELDLKKHGRSGTIFALKNFDWQDKIVQEHEGDVFSGGTLKIEVINDRPGDATQPEATQSEDIA